MWSNVYTSISVFTILFIIVKRYTNHYVRFLTLRVSFIEAVYHSLIYVKYQNFLQWGIPRRRKIHSLLFKISLLVWPQQRDSLQSIKCLYQVLFMDIRVLVILLWYLAFLLLLNLNSHYFLESVICKFICNVHLLKIFIEAILQFNVTTFYWSSNIIAV